MMIEAESLTTWPSNMDAPASAPPYSSDYELAQAAARNDMQAFEQLYLLHHRRIYSLCLRMTANVAEAEDLTQEIFIHFYRKIGSYRGESSLTTWLHRLTVNQVLMHFRKSRGRREAPPPTDDSSDASGTVDTHGSQSAMVARVLLNKAIAQLPPGYRAVFVLHDIEGHEHEEIARLLGCSAGTSKSQLHKARMKLRRLIRGK
jgi:RNA polymerase sigma-70 factor, ECF subfamily